MYLKLSRRLSFSAVSTVIVSMQKGRNFVQRAFVLAEGNVNLYMEVPTSNIMISGLEYLSLFSLISHGVKKRQITTLSGDNKKEE